LTGRILESGGKKGFKKLPERNFLFLISISDFLEVLASLPPPAIVNEFPHFEEQNR